MIQGRKFWSYVFFLEKYTYIYTHIHVYTHMIHVWYSPKQMTNQRGLFFLRQMGLDFKSWIYKWIYINTYFICMNKVCVWIIPKDMYMLKERCKWTYIKGGMALFLPQNFMFKWNASRELTEIKQRKAELL